MSGADWASIVRDVAHWLDEQRATHLARSEDGRLVMPSVAELYDEAGTRDAAKALIVAACKADGRIADAISVACANAKGVDHDLLRGIVALLPTK